MMRRRITRWIDSKSERCSAPSVKQCSRRSRLVSSVTLSLGSITVAFATCSTRIRSSTTVSPVEYAVFKCFDLARIGPRENYFHCEKCNLCLARDLRGNHKCVENVSRQNCPVCMEDIHTSRIGAHVLPCGHLLHKTCFGDMVRTGAYRCPLCMHSAWDMKDHWEQMDEEIVLSPMPAEYQGATVKVICNDCQAHCTVPFHVLGMKCNGCGSYNTAQDGGLIQQPQQEQQPEQDTDNEAETDREPEQQDPHESPTSH
ncbi:RING finger and CHY zinc finger domain-containing protein 1 isoform X2 [Mugil cephalus]|uniref:RING finger and CHY zinc finger domain-containing protein 1 isoform X2 n=1 Tax=Mugil cephalus TaxID=48193 RepID=UPI001FB59D6E|nr:RING finger and CHY zinc finger domain-containing protein 1 isoform X2 [Mugil cephalus]